jgi:ubiquinone/menaquinone biosynthesis C-methylase UbiE
MLSKIKKWYKSFEYDKEGKEVKKIIKLTKLKDKDILVIGEYGIFSIIPKISKYSKSIIGVHDNKKIKSYVKDKKIFFERLNKLKLKDNSFDVILMIWTGFHYNKIKMSVIKEFKRILRKKGILLIEETDDTSEYVEILNLISFKRKSRIKQKREVLKKILKKEFKLKEHKLETFYDFKSIKSFKNYFKNEIIFHEKKNFTNKMNEKLNDYVKQKRNLRVQEKSVLFLCGLK